MNYMNRFNRLAFILEKTDQGKTLSDSKREKIILEMLKIANKKISEIRITNKDKFNENK